MRMHVPSGDPRLDVLFDMRCLQDPNFASRGIGRHAVNLVRNARVVGGRLVQARLVGLVDPRLPALLGDTSALLDSVRTTAYTGGTTRPVCFVQLSPMTHDPLFAARLLHDDRVFKATVIYDFIPYDYRDRYLANAQSRLDYYVALRWLARSNLYLPISRGVGERLREILGVAQAHVVTTGAPLDGAFEPTNAAPPGHGSYVLVIGGPDRRKNVEFAVRAHATAAPLQAGRIPLVITGDYDAQWILCLRNVATSHGGSADLVQVTGHVTQVALVTLYRNALAVVVPSYAEGFSLPIVEGMASRVPVLASDIPAHAELIYDRSQLFPLDDYAMLATSLSRLVLDGEWRNAVVVAQATIWPRFRAGTVAMRFWSAVEDRLKRATALRTPSIVVGHRPKIAFLSPVPPSRSGVADHTAAACVELGRRVDLHVFTETQNTSHLPGAVTVRPLTALPLLSSTFDRVVGVVGNNPEFHAGIFKLLLRYGGAAIVHDARLLVLYCGMLGMHRAAEYAGRELCRTITTADLQRWLSDESTLELMFLGEVCKTAEPIFVHSATTARLISTQYSTATVHLPFCAYREWDSDALLPKIRREARARLGIATAEVVVATFGFVHQTKAPEYCIVALDILRSWRIDAHLYFVGAVGADLPQLRGLAASLGVGKQVHFVGAFIDETVYRDYLLAADVGLQLRLVGMGSISGALSDCIAAGLPTVANDGLAEALDAPAYVARVPDQISPILVAEAIADQLDCGARERPLEKARLAYRDAHNFRVYSERLCHALGLEVSLGL
jgi:glycosyltransferase involved in cell wall biosynthesis